MLYLIICSGEKASNGEWIISGRFITFEGGEGAGKSTQASLLVEKLGQFDIAAVVTREPGGAPGAELIRKLLVEGDTDRWAPFTETLLHIAARHEHVLRTVQPALEAGSWVICDRFFDSTRAYQGYGLGQSIDAINKIHEIVLPNFIPDLTILIDLDVKTGLSRTSLRKDHNGTRYEEMEVEFHHRVRKGFLEIASNDPGRFVILDGNMSIEEMAETIFATVTQHFGVST